MEREVRYCTTSDGVRIAYSTDGDGTPLLVVPFFIESFSLEHLVPAYPDFFTRIGSGRQLVRFDMRDTGLSQRGVAEIQGPALVRDIEAVVQAIGAPHIDLLAMGFGGPQAIEFSARHPSLTRRLILFNTFARLLDVFSAEALKSFAQLARANWELACRAFADLGIRRASEGEGLRMAQWYAQSIDGAEFARYVELNMERDVTSLLPGVRCPTLVLQNTNDPIYTMALGQGLASQIPGARLVAMENVNANRNIGDPEPLVDAVETFLNGEAAPRRVPLKRRGQPRFRTILFTDLVGHTAMMSRLGDERGRDLLREHERITREALKSHGGTEVKTMGDGFMASFVSVTEAVECAVALQQAFAAHAESTPEPLSVRVGLNAGEPIEEDGDLFGATVVLASRIAAKAEGGEILVADTVRGLCSGKGFLFADRGEFVAKGFEERVRVYEVSWRS